MGKSEEEQVLSVLPSSLEPPGGNGGGTGCRHCRWIGRIVRPRCLIAVMLGVAVLLSAVFWLPPFLRDQADRGESDPHSRYGASILASFKLQKTVQELATNVTRLQYDIFDEIGIPNTSVVIISLDPLTGSNWTNVVFGVVPYPSNSVISSAGLSILRSYFVSFVEQEPNLHLTPSLFGNASFFQVLEFPGGITIIPPQSAFLLQKVQIVFNFTLNFSIYQVKSKIGELKDQMRAGLHLASDENLYVSLTNLLGSTLAPPTIVQAAILPAIGTPSKSRVKELAKAITGSPGKNLGLNHTVFGRVKQISLSSYLQHSLNGSNNNGTPWPPSAAPQPHPNNHHHRHHHQHHHHHHHHHHHPSSKGVASAPAPQHNHPGQSPSACQLGSSQNSHVPPVAPPLTPQNNHAFSPPPEFHSSQIPPQTRSPIPAVTFAYVQPPIKSITPTKSPGKMLSSSCCIARFPSFRWAFALVLYLLVHL